MPQGRASRGGVVLYVANDLPHAHWLQERLAEEGIASGLRPLGGAGQLVEILVARCEAEEAHLVLVAALGG